MQMLSPSHSPSSSRYGAPSREHAAALEGLARLSTDVFSEKPFEGLIICVTGLSKGDDLFMAFDLVRKFIVVPLVKSSACSPVGTYLASLLYWYSLVRSVIFFVSSMFLLCLRKEFSCCYKRVQQAQASPMRWLSWTPWQDAGKLSSRACTSELNRYFLSVQTSTTLLT